MSRVALIAIVCFAGHAASAMGVRKNSTLLARSGDGAALFEVREHGPEGGGALTYRVEGKQRSAAVEFLVSSDFSPGNGSRPQRVSATECEQRLTALGAELTRRKIASVTVHPENCRAKRRDGLVVVAKSPH